MHVLAIHGGAGALPRKDMTTERAREFHAALRSALEAGWRAMSQGASSLQAVELTVAWLEDCPLFNAGRGSAFTRDGHVEMEASIMDGATSKVGTAALLRRIRNPVRLARLVMDATPHVTLAGEAAEKFGAARGLATEAPEYFFTPYRWEAMRQLRGTDRTALSEDMVVADAGTPAASGTVGAVAVDAQGNLAAATSSGGTSNKYSGRIGQAAIPGAGVFANNRTCAVSCTGQGEAFMRSVGAHTVAALMEFRGLDLAEATRTVIFDRLPGKGGLVAVDANGRVALPFNTEGMYRGWVDAVGNPQTALYESFERSPAFLP